MWHGLYRYYSSLQDLFHNLNHGVHRCKPNPELWSHSSGYWVQIGTGSTEMLKPDRGNPQGSGCCVWTLQQFDCWHRSKSLCHSSGRSEHSQAGPKKINSAKKFKWNKTMLQKIKKHNKTVKAEKSTKQKNPQNNQI